MALIVRPSAVLELGETTLVFEGLGATQGMARTDRQLWSRAASLLEKRSVEGRRVLELGAGATGALGLAAKVRGASAVTVTDLPVAMEVLAENVRRNASYAPGVHAKSLDWTDPELPDWARRNFDLIVAGDCLFGDSIDAFHRTLAALLDANPHSRALVFNQSNKGLFAFYNKLRKKHYEQVKLQTTTHHDFYCLHIIP